MTTIPIPVFGLYHADSGKRLGRRQGQRTPQPGAISACGEVGPATGVTSRPDEALVPCPRCYGGEG